MKRQYFIAARVVLTVGTMLMLSAPFTGARSDDFYKNHNIKFIIGTGVGGSYDRVARLVALHMGHHIAGQPSIISQNMQGASSIKAANYVYNVAPQDGSVIAMVVQTSPQNQLFRFPNVKYDSAKFQWIGNPSSSVIVFGIWHTSPVKSIDDAKHQQVLFGASNMRGADGLLPTVIDHILGTKFKVVTGYKGGGAVMLALQRGEILGRGGLSWDGWKASRPDWIKDHKVKFILQIGLTPDKELPQIPLAINLAKTGEDRQVLKLFSTASALGYPILTGQHVPQERVHILRQAFHETMKDPAFLKDARKERVHIAPMYGEELQQAVDELLHYPPAVVAKAKAAMKH